MRAAFVGMLLILGMWWTFETANKPKQVPLGCDGAKNITYDYVIDGMTVTDTITGEQFNIYSCIPLNHKRSV